MKRGGPLQRRTPLKSRPPTRRPSGGPTRPRRKPAPDREFWQHQREHLYARAGGRCEVGGCPLDDTGMEAHHRQLRSQDGGHGLENLLALCPRHHNQHKESVHDNPTRSRMYGWIVPAGRDPGARAVLLWDGRTVRLTPEGGYDVCWDDHQEEAG